jgi:fructosamine-3-kinase
VNTVEAVLEIISNVFSERALKISQLTGKGSVNEIFIVETENSKLVVRMNDANSLDEYKKEVWSVNRAKEKNIPVSEILNVGVFGEKAYSIQKFIEGSEGRDSSIDKKFIWEKLGEYASRIHKIKVAGFGLGFSDLLEGNAEKSWLKYLDYNIESLNEDDELLKLGVMTIMQSENIRNIFENLRLRKFEFGLNHGDLSLKNTIVDDFGTVHLVDWGSAEASIVPHHDLIELLKMNMLENNPDDAEFRAFLDGYDITSVEYEMMLPDLKGLSLLRALDKLRWAMDWKIANLEDYIFEAKETVKNFLL